MVSINHCLVLFTSVLFTSVCAAKGDKSTFAVADITIGQVAVAAAAAADEGDTTTAVAGDDIQYPTCPGSNVAYNSNRHKCACKTRHALASDTSYKKCPPPKDSGTGLAVCSDTWGCGLWCSNDLVINGDTCSCPPGYVASKWDKTRCYLRPSAKAQMQNIVKRNQKLLMSSNDADTCPDSAETVCRLPSGGFECVDLNSTVTACGSCDNDCTANTYHSRGVGCSDGKCIALSCQRGYALRDGGCVASLTTGFY